MSLAKRFLLLTVAGFTLAGSALAQSTIFNIPSTDAVSKGAVYLEFDYLPQMPVDGNRVQIAMPRGVVGLGANVEAGVNVNFTHVPGSTNAFFQPNIKWKFLNNDDSGLAASMGGILYTPLNNRNGVDTYGLMYGNFSKKIKKDYGPRLTVGPYGLVGTEGWAGPRGGIIAGFEQPIHPKVNIVGDFISGKNAFGYFTPGVSITLPRSGLLNVGYSLGNDSYDGNNNRFLFVYYGVTF